jgi:hypothetical protein
MDKALETYRQGKLINADTEVTISAGGKVAKITGEQLENLSKLGHV